MSNEQSRNETIESLKQQLRNPTRLISENREAVVVYKDELEAMLTYVEILEGYVEDLEETVATVPDTKSDLSVGDEVVTLITYNLTKEGTRGIVETILSSEVDGSEYPYRIRFEGEKYAIGYNRYELGKVAK